MADKIDTLIARLAERLNAMSMSERHASLAATSRPDAIRYIRVRRAMPSAVRLAGLASILQTTPAYLLGDTDDPTKLEIEKEENLLLESEQDIELTRLNKLPMRRIGISFLYLSDIGERIKVTSVEGGLVEVETIVLEKRASEPIEVPPWYMDRAVFGVRLPLPSLAPAFEAGWPYISSLLEQPQVGDYCFAFLEIHQLKGDAPIFGIAIVGRVIGLTEKELTLAQYAPRRRFVVERSRIKRLSRVLTMDDLLTTRGKYADEDLDAA